LVAILVALGGLTYIWLSAQRPGGTPGNAEVVLRSVQTGLPYPIALAFASDGRIFFAERFTGKIQILGNATKAPSTFFTVPGVASSGERGLLGLALDPEFAINPYMYVYQTYNDAINGTIYNRIIRILADGDTGRFDSVILRMPPLSGATNHNGGVIAFGPDGKLYAVVGENANAELAQDPMSPMGKVLRMNPNGSAPADNPLYSNPNWNNLTYTYGHRNMFGLAFHPFDGRPYVTENGPSCNDEVNRLVAGGNFGWGANQTCSQPPAPPVNTNRDGPDPIVLPIRWYTPVIVPTNAAFYTASVPTSSRGHLVVGSYADRGLHELTLDPVDGISVVQETILATADEPIIDVEMGLDGYLWVTTPSTIYRLVPAPPPVSSLPAASLPIVPFTLLLCTAARPIAKRTRHRSVGRNTDHPGSLSRDRGVSAARCRHTGSRAMLASGNPSLAS
jgi:glucose/arabinose dehydrogenase